MNPAFSFIFICMYNVQLHTKNTAINKRTIYPYSSISASSFLHFWQYRRSWKKHPPIQSITSQRVKGATAYRFGDIQKKAGTDSFSSIPALKPRYPLDNTSFFGCQLFRFRNKISFFGSFAFSYPLCFYYLVVCWFILQEHLFLFLISICLPAFLW